MAAPPLVAQTTYAELLERCANAAFDDAFAEEGAFTAKTIKGRRYWYFQSGTGDARTQRYVGPETPELLAQIERHQTMRNDERQRRTLVSALLRSYNLPGPIPRIGDIIAGLAKAGVFRLRGVLVGTAAYQTYSAMLGIRLSASLLQTADVDIAQFKDVSVAVEYSTPPVIDILRNIDKSFRDIPNESDSRRSTSYVDKDGIRVDFLTPSRGTNSDKPQPLPSLETAAQPLPFLDYLIHQPEPAVILHDAGIYLHVPAPARFAVHKLIVSQRRPEGFAKRDKDLRQAETLLAVLAERRPQELKLAWHEAYARGPTWRSLLIEGLSQIGAPARDLLLKVIDSRRSMIPGLDLTFNNPPARYDFSRDIVTFEGTALASPVTCAVSREALDDHFGADGLGQDGRVEQFRKNRSKIELMARAKYLSWPVEEPGAVLIKTMDVPKLLKQISGAAPVASSGGPKGGSRKKKR
jgi:hypothetical protein